MSGPDIARLIARIEATDPTVRVDDARALDGGRSGHTWSATWTDASGDRPIAIKAGGPGRPTKGRHDMERQGRVMAALAGFPTVAVPEVLLCLDGDPQVLVTSFVAGECCEPTMDGCEHIAPAVLDHRARAAAKMLAALHALEPSDLAIGGEPPTGLRDEVDRWSRVMGACDPATVPGGDEVIARLSASIPDDRPPRLVHGDFRLGNLLCGDESVHAVIDWEIWSVTDPRVDLGWFLLYSDQSDWPGVAGPMDGMPPARELAREYEASGGSLDDVDWFVAFGRMKMAAITAHNLLRHRTGRRHDPTQERFTEMIVRMLERATSELTPA